MFNDRGFCRLLAVFAFAVVLGMTDTWSACLGSEANAAKPEAWKAEILQKPLKAFCIDFNWHGGSFAKPGHWADADPAQHVAWYDAFGVNVIQTFVLSCNGYAWYKGGPVPEQPELKHDFLTEVVRLGHQKHKLVFGYFCVGGNSLWVEKHPDKCCGKPNELMFSIPLTNDYIDYLCAVVEDSLRKTNMDGFMLDTFVNGNSRGKWLDVEKALYVELMAKPFPGADKVEGAYYHRAQKRCWTRIRDTARRVKPDCILWANGLGYADYEGMDWVLNEPCKPDNIEKTRRKLGEKPMRMFQNVVGSTSREDAKKVLEDPKCQTWDFYGCAAPNDTSLLLSIDDYLGQPVDKFIPPFQANIAALARFYLGKSRDYVAPAGAPK